MSSDMAKRDRRNRKYRLKGSALGAFQLETWHEQCRKERKNWKCYRSPGKTSLDGDKVMAAMDEKPRDRGGRTVQYRGGCFYGTPPFPNQYWHARYGVKDIPMLKARGLL